MGKLILDNRIVVSAFLALAFLNAFALQSGWYA